MLPSSVALTGQVMAAVAAACTGSFLFMDCNPSLYWYDRYLQVTAPSISSRRGKRDSITAASASASASATSVHGAPAISSNTAAGSCAVRTGYHNFQDTRCVWILGASSGIGRAMAEQLAVAGVSHLILSSRSSTTCQSVAQQCRHLNPDCQLTVLPVNVTDTDALERAVDDITAMPDVPPLDMVVMNAGVGQLQPALETDAATTEHMLRSNALWPMVLTPLLFNAKQTSQQSTQSLPRTPHLVVTSSIAGKLAVPLSAAYAASKCAVQGYFSSLACERPDVRMDLLCPGPVDTAFHRNGLDADKTNEPTAPSKMKMPVDRCVALMLSAMQRNRPPQNSQSQRTSQSLLSLLLQPLLFQEHWIAIQPSLTALYIQQWFPGLQRRILAIVGPKRVQLWREGYDLYNPASWRQSSTSTTKTKASASASASASGSNDKDSANVNDNHVKAVVDNVNSNQDQKKDE